MKLIEVKKLSKSIQGKEILRHISFDIEEGVVWLYWKGWQNNSDGLSLGIKFLTSGQKPGSGGIKPTDNRLKEMVAILPPGKYSGEIWESRELLAFFRSLSQILPVSEERKLMPCWAFLTKQKNQLRSLVVKTALLLYF